MFRSATEYLTTATWVLVFADIMAVFAYLTILTQGKCLSLLLIFFEMPDAVIRQIFLKAEQ